MHLLVSQMLFILIWLELMLIIGILWIGHVFESWMNYMLVLLVWVVLAWCLAELYLRWSRVHSEVHSEFHSE